MEELLQKLLENDLLNDETKSQLNEEFEAQLKEAREEAKSETEKAVRAELTEQFIKDKEQLIEAIDTKVDEFLTNELSELKEDIESFRDLEVEYAEKLVESREEFANALKEDMGELVNTLDTFLEVRLTEGLTELKESIVEVQKGNFSNRILEAFKDEFNARFADENGTENKLNETQQRLEETEAALETASEALEEATRTKKLGDLLASLQGRPKEVMEAILRNVTTEQLDEAYESYIGRVLHESSDTSEDDKNTETVEEGKSEKETKVLAESESTEKPATEATKVVTGDGAENDTEEVTQSLTEAERDRIRKLIGVERA